MKVYTHYSESHKDLYENYFKKSLRELYTKDEIAIRSACHKQTTSSLCAGFFIAKGNDNIFNLFTKIYKTFRQLVNDQVALNRWKGDVNYKLLDKAKYYTIGNFYDNPDGTHVWDNSTNIIPPSSIKMHHANYVVGVKNKINLINMLRENYEKV